MKTKKEIFKAILVAGLLIGSFLLIKPYFHAIFLGIITAYLLQPLYKTLKNKTKKEGLSKWITVIILIAIMLIIGTVVVNIILVQLNVFTSELKLLSKTNDLKAIFGNLDIASLLEQINKFASRIPYAKIQVDEATLVKQIQNVLKNLVNFLVGILPNVGAFSTAFVLNLIVYFATTFTLISKFDFLIDYIKRISPMDDKFDINFINKGLVMSKAMVKGTFVIALTVGVSSALVLALLGVNYSIFWGFIITILSILPLGGGLVTIPIALVFIFGEQYAKGAILLLYQIILAGNIDTILRPKLVPKEARIPEILILISVLGGLKLFGFMGILYGPIIVALTLTGLESVKQKKA